MSKHDSRGISSCFVYLPDALLWCVHPVRCAMFEGRKPASLALLFEACIRVAHPVHNPWQYERVEFWSIFTWVFVLRFERPCMRSSDGRRLPHIQTPLTVCKLSHNIQLCTIWAPIYLVSCDRTMFGPQELCIRRPNVVVKENVPYPSAKSVRR